MSPDDDKQPSGGQGGEGGSGGGTPKPSPTPQAPPPIRNPAPPRSDPGGVTVRWELPKPFKPFVD